jgi:hypothetical protein
MVMSFLNGDTTALGGPPAGRALPAFTLAEASSN